MMDAGVSAEEQRGVVRGTAIVLTIAVLAGGAFLFLYLNRAPTHDRATPEDECNAHLLTTLVREYPRPPSTEDGRVDVFRVLDESLGLDETTMPFLRHRRLDRKPSLEEVRAGDYRHFAWRRARVADLAEHPNAPVLWDPFPIRGRRVVSFFDGRTRLLSEEEFEALPVRPR